MIITNYLLRICFRARRTGNGQNGGVRGLIPFYKSFVMRGGSMYRKLIVGAAVCVLTMASRASAQERMPSFNTVPLTPTKGTPNAWAPDRTAPSSFGSIGAFGGRSDVLGIGILGSSPSGNAGGTGFYALQGRSYANPTPGPWKLSADLWVESTWASSPAGQRRAEMWGLSTNSSTQVAGLPAIGFTNEGSGTGRFRWATGSWNETWADLTATVNYGTWNSLGIEFDQTNSLFNYFVNGVQVASSTSTVAVPVFGGGTLGGASTGFSGVIMQTYNYGQNYSVNWSNTSTVPEPSTGLLVLLGLSGLLLKRHKTGTV